MQEITSLEHIQAVAVEGMSRRAAAERFGVAPTTAVELLRQWKATGACGAGPQGGDRRSGPIEAHATELVAPVEATPDFTLAEIADHLFAAHGERIVSRVLWRFFVRRAISFKRKRRTPANRIGQTWWLNARQA